MTFCHYPLLLKSTFLQQHGSVFRVSQTLQCNMLILSINLTTVLPSVSHTDSLHFTTHWPLRHFPLLTRLYVIKRCPFLQEAYLGHVSTREALLPVVYIFFSGFVLACWYYLCPPFFSVSSLGSLSLLSLPPQPLRCWDQGCAPSYQVQLGYFLPTFNSPHSLKYTANYL